MSTKKDKFSTKDKLYMEIALKLAKSRYGHTGSNPSVGCVIVKNNKILYINLLPLIVLFVKVMKQFHLKL